MEFYRKSQTRREAGTESHGSLNVNETAGLPGKAIRLYVDTEEVHMTKLVRFSVLADFKPGEQQERC
jgi:hypothetical protein